MKLILTGRHFSVPASARTDIERRLARLERLLGDAVVSAQCAVGREKAAFVCEITVHARGDHMLRGAGRDARLGNAVAAASQKVQQQARKLADRWKHRRKAGRGAAAGPAGDGAAPLPARAAETTRPARPAVVRSRREAVKPMSLDDAVLALSGSDDPFLVFRLAPDETVAVLFRRPDGRFGLIDPGA